MTRARSIPFFAVCLMISASFVGCSEAQKSFSSQNQASHVNEGYTSDYAAEMKEVNQALAVKGKFASDLPTAYKISADVELTQESDADRLDYRVTIRKPVLPLRNLTMSFSLHPKMKDQLLTDDVFTSNTLNEEPISYSPNDDTNSIILSRAFIIDQHQINKNLLNIYTDVYVKISYIDPAGEAKSDYIQLKATPSEPLLQYIQSSLALKN